jgi:preprotein translocase subunit SecB
MLHLNNLNFNTVRSYADKMRLIVFDTVSRAAFQVLQLVPINVKIIQGRTIVSLALFHNALDDTQTKDTHSQEHGITTCC